MQLSQPIVPRLRVTFARTLLCAGLGLLLGGCASSAGQQQMEAKLADVNTQLDAVRAELARTREELEARDAAARSADAALADGVTGLEARLEALPAALTELCPAAPAPAATPKCEPKIEVRTVTVNSDKLVFGRNERVIVEPPGAILVAGIDTGADSSSLHAEDLVEFERDGSRWVRFTITTENGGATLERPIKRFARVVQQADPKGSRRPVVELLVRLGDARESVEFTLADRSHMSNEILLGRNFLTDLAVVDVGKEFLQPPPQPEAKDQ
jgi:outer membrane murein-binding lipoprotein Lpp